MIVTGNRPISELRFAFGGDPSAGADEVQSVVRQVRQRPLLAKPDLVGQIFRVSRAELVTGAALLREFPGVIVVMAAAGEGIHVGQPPDDRDARRQAAGKKPS